MSANSPGSKLLSFEGLRGIAALVVVVWHIKLALWLNLSNDVKAALSSMPSPISRLIRAIIDGMQNGTLAVWIFWVMSAAVLSLRFFADAKDSTNSRSANYLEAAAVRRYPRLLVPVLASVLFAYGLHAWGLMHNVELAQELGPRYDEWLGKWYRDPPSLLAALKSAFWDTFFAYSDSTTYNCALWTMEKEFFGSLLLFAFLSLFGSRQSRFILYPVIAMANFFLGMHWINAFLVGIIICDVFTYLIQHDNVRELRTVAFLSKFFSNRWVSLSSWLVIIILAGLPFSDSYNLVALSLACAAVVLSLASLTSKRFLSSAIPVFLGKISFSLYLVHVPLICSFTCWFYLSLSTKMSHATAAAISGAVTMLLAVALGYILYLVADRWSISISRYVASFITTESDGKQHR